MALYENEMGNDLYAPPQAAPPEVAPAPPQAAPPQENIAAGKPLPQGNGNAPEAAPAKEDNYGVGSAIVDMLAFKLGFGTPIANVQRLKIAGDEDARRAESHKLQVADEERKQMVDQAGRALAGPMIAVAKPDSPYYGDLTHLQAVNGAPAVKKMLGGALKVDPTDKIGKDGSKIFRVAIVGEDGQERDSFEATTSEAIDRFDATLNPAAKQAIRNHIATTVADQEGKIALARKMVDESYAVKRAAGVPTTEYDKYVDIKKQFPEMSDWQAREASGLKVEDRYRPLGTSPVPMEDGKVGIAVMDRNDGDKVKMIALPGTTWSQYKAGTKKEAEQWKNLYWPDTDEDLAHEKKAKGIFGAVLDATQDPNEQRRLMKDVLPQFREWAELHTGEETGKDGKPRKLTTGDMQKKLEEMIKAGGGGAAAGGGVAATYDNGNIGMYARAKQRAAVEGGRKYLSKPPESAPPAGNAFTDLYNNAGS
jgi:hypothetical protein